MNTRKLVSLGLLSAIALTIFMVEAQIPPIVPLPGVKIGLANIVTVFTVFVLGGKEGAAVLFVRVSWARCSQETSVPSFIPPQAVPVRFS